MEFPSLEFFPESWSSWMRTTLLLCLLALNLQAWSLVLELSGQAELLGKLGVMVELGQLGRLVDPEGRVVFYL